MDRNAVLLNVIKEDYKNELREELKQELRADIELDIRKEIEKERKDEMKSNPPFSIFENNTYVNIDLFSKNTGKYFGIDADSLKRSLCKNGVVYYNGNKYVPNDDFEGVVIYKNGKLFLNRDELDKYVMTYLLERMSIKNIRDSFEKELEYNKTALIQELYEISNAEFQRQSPVFKEIRLGVNSVSKIDM